MRVVIERTVNDISSHYNALRGTRPTLRATRHSEAIVAKPALPYFDFDDEHPRFRAWRQLHVT